MAEFSSIRQRLEAAVKRWEQSVGISVPVSKEADRAELIRNLMLFAAHAPGGVNRAFRTPNRETTQKELSDIATRASALATRLRDPKRSTNLARQQLAACLDDMHGTTIAALAMAPGLLDIGVVRRELPRALRDDSVDRGRLANVLDRLGQVATDAVPTNTQDEGRWPDRRAQIVANFLARYCRDATGRVPTITTRAESGQHYGAFLDLVSDVFSAMGIERKAFSCAYAAAEQLRRAELKKSTP